MKNWKMITIIGTDQKGIVAAVTAKLEQYGFNLGETSMMSLAGNFTIMMMAKCAKDYQYNKAKMTEHLQPVVDAYNLTLHIDEVELHEHKQMTPNMSIAVHGADRAGIVADVTDVMAELDFNIIDLYSDINGKGDDASYILHVEGCCDKNEETLYEEIIKKVDKNIKVVVTDITTLVG